MTDVANIKRIAVEGDIVVWAAPIAPLAGASRRERERCAVAALVEAAMGPAAELRHEPSGMPYIYVGHCLRSISISHCSDTAMLAVAPAGVAIGIDCEHYRPALRSVAPRFLAPEEMPLWGASDELLLRAWTVKEAVYKAAATPGLSLADISLPHPAAPLGPAVAAGRCFRLIVLPGMAPAVTIAVVSGNRGQAG